jgi:hypothetical protein
MRNPVYSLVAAAAIATMTGCGSSHSSADMAAPADLAMPATPDLAMVGEVDLAMGPDMTAVSSAKAITAFSFATPAATGVIDESAKTITIGVPYATNVTALVASFTTTGASVAVGATAQVSGTTANDFTSPVTYVVTAADASTASYVVTVNKIPSAPTVTWPVAAQDVVTPLTIQGVALAGATVNVQVKNGATVIGTGSGAGSARLNFTATYTEPAAATALTLVVTQTIGGQTSAATTLTVNQGIAGTITYGANQNPGGAVADYSGAKMYVQVYASGVSNLPLQSQVFDVTVGSAAPLNNFPFHLAAAAAGGTTYYCVSFRDSNGNGLYDPGEPTTGPRIGNVATQGGSTIDSGTMQPP